MLIFLAVTGIALNHSPALNLSKTTISSHWVQSWYGIERSSVPHGFKLDNNWLYHDGDKQIFFNEGPVIQCKPPLLSATIASQMIIGLCSDMLVLLTSKGQVVETFSTLQGLPENTSALQTRDGQLLLQVGQQVKQFDVDDMSVEQSIDSHLQPLPSQPLPKKMASNAFGEGISLETLILDLHSGRFFGSAGVLFVDLIGILICVLSITGLWGWINHQRLRKL